MNTSNKFAATESYRVDARVTISRGINMSHIDLSNGQVVKHGYTIDLHEHGIVLDMDANGRLVGIEMFNCEQSPPKKPDPDHGKI